MVSIISLGFRLDHYIVLYVYIYIYVCVCMMRECG